MKLASALASTSPSNQEVASASTDSYEIASIPNDFNIRTIADFVKSGAVKVPGFQPILIGLPIPQIFLYEKARNSFLVIDGQQRLMSIFSRINQNRMTNEDTKRIRQAALEVAALIKPLVELRLESVNWSQPYLVGLLTTTIGLLFRLNMSPLNDDELMEALVIAWREITATPWADRFELLRSDAAFKAGADNASKFVRAMYFEGQGAAEVWREVFAPRD